VEDIRAEWEDRYGPVPPAAAALLNVGHLRAECHRLGLRDVSIAASGARLAPLPLKVSEGMRLRRLARKAIYKDDSEQLVVPLPHGQDPALFLVGFLRELIPPVPVAATAG
jgi:transcription-repair coupling factor (superfamily II helicase)